MMFLILPLLLLCILVGLHLFKQYLTSIKYKDFPGPSPLLSVPLIGHGHLFGPDVPQGLLDLQAKYGDIFRFDLGGVPSVHLCTHELVTKAYKMDVFNGKGPQRVLDAAAKRDIHGKNNIIPVHKP